MAEREYKVPTSEREHFANPPILTRKTRVKVHIPDELEATRQQHVWDDRRVNGEVVGYAPVTYDREENEFPKLLYHPKWGEKMEPRQQDFARPNMTGPELEAALTAFNSAREKWQRDNRTKLVATPEAEKRLLEKGWLPKPPENKKAQKAFAMDSDEI